METKTTEFAIHVNHLQKLDQALGTCGCKVCKRSPLARHSLVRRQGGPASIITPADEASAEDEREEEGDEGGKKEDEGDEDEDEGDEDEDEGDEDEGDEDASFEKVEKDEAEMEDWQEI